ncbi:MAG: TlpA disulfide reductase family protein [Actinomycetota bacterium]
MRGQRLPIVLIALSLTACTGPPSDNAPRTSVPAENAARATLLPTDAQELPDFGFADYQALLEQLRGTPVLVNIWGSWCGPCREEAHDLARLHDEYGDTVQFIGIDILDARSSARTFMQEFGWTYPSLYDSTGEIRNRLGYIGQPDTVLYDGDGRRVGEWQGPINAAEVEAAIRKLT